MRLLTKAAAGAVLGAAMLAGSAMSASAAIVCRGNVCWHTHEAFDYPHEAGVVVHEDNWHWGPRERFVFREHEGRGYWRGSRWIGW
ncbi:MAG: hypothetical protein JOY90_29165 [Bradyrhizobium sp.]|uniref:hypothetical protein n=1 Tax=Bradyrhizobium sp. TaxID=376 RepID=UPI001DCD434E|nr:hypothetical protein [Bradyrhizobium sp.]MBV9564480.1 hypothetical protein [Bradyrhizobium sp.]